MGAWGTQSFECDGALDWLGDFIDDPTESTLREAFCPSPVVRTPGFFARLLGAKATSTPVRPYGEHVLAAAEVVAIMLGHPPCKVPESLAKLPQRQPSQEIVLLAIQGVDQILDESSDLHESWKDTDVGASEGREPDPEGDYQKWLNGVRELRTRLTAS